MPRGIDRTPLIETTRFGTGNHHLLKPNPSEVCCCGVGRILLRRLGVSSRVFSTDFLITIFDLWMMKDDRSPSFGQEVWGFAD